MSKPRNRDEWYDHLGKEFRELERSLTEEQRTDLDAKLWKIAFELAEHIPVAEKA
jgi:hypothetical protein